MTEPEARRFARVLLEARHREGLPALTYGRFDHEDFIVRALTVPIQRGPRPPRPRVH